MVLFPLRVLSIVILIERFEFPYSIVDISLYRCQMVVQRGYSSPPTSPRTYKLRPCGYRLALHERGVAEAELRIYSILRTMTKLAVVVVDIESWEWLGTCETCPYNTNGSIIVAVYIIHWSSPRLNVSAS